MSLDTFRTLGRSGLVVSPLALGTMTFGKTGWGSPDDVSEAVFNAYVDAGGNFIDTADVYGAGRSEELLGGYIGKRKLRDQLVLATKFAFNAQDGNPNTGGNGRKSIHHALDGSLRRLGMDSIDLYWLHVWDMVTPVEEVLQTLGDLVRAGKVRYFGFSDTPAWYAAKAAALAAVHGVPGPIALQLPYSLVERGMEREHVPAARDCGMGITPWSPLASGFLTGKYQRGDAGIAGEGRLSGPNPSGDSLFTDRNWRILDTLRSVAAEAERPLAQVALAWAAAQPGVTSVLLGAGKLAQLHDNLASQDVVLSPAHRDTLNTASGPSTDSLFNGFFTPDLRRMIFGGTTVEGG